MSVSPNVEYGKVQPNGRVTIPKKMREELDILGGQYVKFAIEDGKVTIDQPQ